jgi:hypothetical protein
MKGTKMATDLNLIANDKALLKRFTKETVNLIQKVDIRKHEAACMTFFHAAQYGECHNLNILFNGLAVNDKTALKAWIAKHSEYADDNGKPKHWIMFDGKKDEAGNIPGWRIVKGTEAKRKDVIILDELLNGERFFDKDVRPPKNWDLNAILDTLIKAADTAENKSDKNNVSIPLNIMALVQSLKVEAANAKTLPANGNADKVISNVA